MSSDVETFLEHHGVLGMHWGHHKSGGGASTSGRTTSGRTTSGHPSRAQVRQVNRVNKAQAKVVRVKESLNKANAHDTAVLNARNNLNKHHDRYQIARAQYKVDKQIVGKVAARQKLLPHKTRYQNTLKTAALETNQERTDRIKKEFAAGTEKFFNDRAAARSNAPRW